MSPIVPKVGFNGRFVCDCTLTMISYYADADRQNLRYPIAIAMTAIRFSEFNRRADIGFLNKLCADKTTLDDYPAGGLFKVRLTYPHMQNRQF